MKLTILGCSGSIPGPDSPSSGYLLESGGTRIVLDLGNGTLGALQRFIDPFALDALFFSHLHPDHCADFGALAVLRRYHPNPPEHARLPVIAPANAPERFAALYAPNAEEQAETDLSDVFEFIPTPAEPVRIGPFEVQAMPVAHLCEAWGFRVAAEGKVLAYTGDTGPCPQLAELAANADVLLSEASWADFPDAPDGVHLSGRQAAEVAKTAEARRLLLTHVVPWADGNAILAEAEAVFDGPAELVAADRTYEI
ncbi:Ribonuclease BN, tRNA processing enzyme [Saccharopolyspora kobensis]|uniref:Ribonuclease BN, tRNA processing enzyme n=1 Tax=Saccharopolyspora kobensis TaxID=146035 RepID=A0A1H6CSM1_9PSEU|nr:MBL fold metallo-hydrolase [Saccharopolyspora kobensis]SEG76029.1 Ribonuclease BN, tRNA processing enzyme [Saccharopolyspora kobensis]SFC98237.1 Ribonuclease BN, tRNA processing enzyme [Saccharopolyspora kobensis]